MDAYLKKAGSDKRNAAGPLLKFNAEYYKKTKKLKASRIPVNKRTIDIEDTPGFGLNQIKTEADRCFNCGCVSVNASDTGVALEALNARVKIVGAKGPGPYPLLNSSAPSPMHSKKEILLQKSRCLRNVMVPGRHSLNSGCVRRSILPW